MSPLASRGMREGENSGRFRWRVARSSGPAPPTSFINKSSFLPNKTLAGVILSSDRSSLRHNVPKQVQTYIFHFHSAHSHNSYSDRLQHNLSNPNPNAMIVIYWSATVSLDLPLPYKVNLERETNRRRLWYSSSAAWFLKDLIRVLKEVIKVFYSGFYRRA